MHKQMYAELQDAKEPSDLTLFLAAAGIVAFLFFGLKPIISMFA